MGGKPHGEIEGRVHSVSEMNRNGEIEEIEDHGEIGEKEHCGNERK